MNGKVHVDLIGDQAGAVKQVQVSFVAEDGTVYSAGEPMSVSPGNTVTYGTVSAHVTLESEAGYEPTSDKGTSPQPGPAPPAAAAHPTPPRPGQRR